MTGWSVWYQHGEDRVLLVRTEAPWWLHLANWLSNQCVPAWPVPFIGRIVVNRSEPEWRMPLADWIGDGKRVTVDDLWHHAWTGIPALFHQRRVGEVSIPRADYMAAMGAHAERWIVEKGEGL